MRINKFLFPLFLLIIFLGIIALGVAAGYWQTKGGGGHGHESGVLVPAAAQIYLQNYVFDGSEWLWQL